MAFVSERRIAIGNALERAYFELINAREAKTQAMDDKTMLWYIYKAQKCLKEAAALLVDTTNSSPSLRAFDRTRGNQQAENPDTVDSHEASTSRDDALTMFIKREATRINEMHRAFDKWLENTKALIKMCDNPEPLKDILATQIQLRDNSLQGVREEWEIIQTFQDIEKPMFFRWLEETKALIKMCDNPEPLKGILATQIQLKDDLQGIMKSADKIREENR